MIPVLEEIASELPDNCQIVKVDVDESQELAMEYGVMSIPAFKLFKNGELVGESLGAQSKDAIVELFESNK